MKMRSFIATLFFMAIAVVAVPVPAFAQMPSLLPLCATTGATTTTTPNTPTAGQCSTCDFVALFGNWAEILAYATVAPVLLFIALGGVWWLTSAGNPERIQAGQKMMSGAVIGAVIVFTAYIIVNFMIASLKGETNLSKEVKLFGTDWNNVCGRELDRTISNDCAEAGDGARCEANGCDDGDYCQCFEGQCESLCHIVAYSQSLIGACNSDCSESNQTQSEVPGLCVPDFVCCFNP